MDEKLSEKGVCVAVKAKLSKDSGVGKGIDFDHIVEKLQAKPKAKGKYKLNNKLSNNSAIRNYSDILKNNCNFQIKNFPSIVVMIEHSFP